jgi:dynein heavy chain, axonemal
MSKWRATSCALTLQGITSIHPASCGTDAKETLAKLWLHENLRAFHDRLVTASDQTYLTQLLHSFLAPRFGCRDSYSDIFEAETPLLFGTLHKFGVHVEDRVYELIAGTPHS